MDAITHDALRYIMPHARNLALFLEPLNEAAELYGIFPPKRLPAWIANLAHESGEFRYMEEIADGSAYDGRADLGNTLPEAIEIARKNGTTPGRWWKGHGPIQITGFSNHRACGLALGLDLLNEPRLLCAPAAGCLAAGWFWSEVAHANRYADAGDFDGACDVVNFGRKTSREGDTNGYAARLQYFARAKEVFGG